MISEAEFVGGPADGRLQAFPGDEPPQECILHAPAGSPLPVVMVTDRYRRRASPRGDGPLWQLVYEGAPR